MKYTYQNVLKDWLPNVDKGMEKVEFSNTTDGNVKWHDSFGKQLGSLSVYLCCVSDLFCSWEFIQVK